jgi:hypothetical protein
VILMGDTLVSNNISGHIDRRGLDGNRGSPAPARRA